jgi:hypothetical protein
MNPSFEISKESKGKEKSSSLYPRDTTFRDDPNAHKIYDKMIETIQNANTMYYESDLEQSIDGANIGKGHYKIWLKKPNYVRIEAYRYEKAKGVLIGEGGIIKT